MGSGRAEFVLDATAVIAVLSLEPGHQKVAGILDNSIVSAVNLAETVNKLVERGSAPEDVRSFLGGLNLKVEDWLEESAYASAEFAHLGRSHGLALGGRACLTLARQLQATAVTSDRTWTRIPRLGVSIILFR